MEKGIHETQNPSSLAELVVGSERDEAGTERKKDKETERRCSKTGQVKVGLQGKELTRAAERPPIINSHKLIICDICIYNGTPVAIQLFTAIYISPFKIFCTKKS